MNDEQQVFRRLAFCWHAFEHDGLTDTMVAGCLGHVDGPILVVGSGQGLVSQGLQRAGFEVVSVDSEPEMAVQAQARRNIATRVADFFELEADPGIRTVLVNTGVVTPSLVRTRAEAFARQLRRLVPVDGRVVLSYFQRTAFMDVAEEMGLRQSLSLLDSLCRRVIDHGERVQEALARCLPPAYPRNGLEAFPEEWADFQGQILAAYALYEGPQDPHTVLPQALRYVPFGLREDKRVHLMQTLERAGLVLEHGWRKDSVHISILRGV